MRYLIGPATAASKNYTSHHSTKKLAKSRAQMMANRNNQNYSIWVAASGDFTGNNARLVESISPTRATNSGKSQTMRYAIGQHANSPGSWYSTHNEQSSASTRAKRLALQTGNSWYVFKSPTGHFHDDGVLVKEFKGIRSKNSGDSVSIADWVPCHAYRKLNDGTVQVLTESEGVRQANKGKRKRIANVAQGFFANGVFHPVRASFDYDQDRAGETRTGKKRAAKKPATKRAATKTTTRRKSASVSSAPKPRKRAATKTMTAFQKKKAMTSRGPRKR